MCYHLYVKLRYDTNGFISEIETDPQTQSTGFAKGEWGAKAWTGSLGLADANYYI